MNADSLSVERWQSRSNAKVDKLAHRRKQSLEIVSIDEGMQIDWREKAFGVKSA
jgi:hypothetical protein